MKKDDLESPRLALRQTLLELLGPGEVPRLGEALTHPSFANETPVTDNQRLEFLGDAVLGLCVSELLSEMFPAADEGELTRLRAALVNADALARWARTVDLGASIALGRGARAGTERAQTNVLADAVEALVASVYLAHGLAGAQRLAKAIMGESLADATETGARDPKSQLQERVQAKGSPAPVYRVVSSRGPEHAPTFVVEVLVAGEIAGTGEGPSKRVAERAAAQSALNNARAASEAPTAPAAETEPDA
jgi:ribonuclease III